MTAMRITDKHDTNQTNANATQLKREATLHNDQKKLQIIPIGNANYVHQRLHQMMRNGAVTNVNILFATIVVIQ